MALGLAEWAKRLNHVDGLMHLGYCGLLFECSKAALRKTPSPFKRRQTPVSSNKNRPSKSTRIQSNHKFELAWPMHNSTSYDNPPHWRRSAQGVCKSVLPRALTLKKKDVFDNISAGSTSPIKLGRRGPIGTSHCLQMGSIVQTKWVQHAVSRHCARGSLVAQGTVQKPSCIATKVACRTHDNET